MTDKNIKDQDVTEQQGFNEAEGSSSCEGASCANMADDEQHTTDTMAEESSAEEQSVAEPTPEEIIAVWRDKYMRLQAEFDNYRKRTLREKMDLVLSGGADVIKSMLSVLDDMYRAVAASEKSEDIAALREGEKLVLQKFEEALRQKNVTEIEVQDKEFDRANGLHSIPAKFSVRTSLYISIALHVVTIACLAWFVALLPQSVWIWVGAAIFTAIIIAEHIIVTPTRQRNIPIAFGTLNGLASLSLAIFVIIGLLTA